MAIRGKSVERVGSGNATTKKKMLNHHAMSQLVDPSLPAEALFLSEIQRLNPDVLRSLKEVSEARTRQPSQKEVRLWARRWNLDYGWMIEWALHTVSWQRTGPSGRWDRFHHPAWAPASRMARRFTITDAIRRRISDVDFGDWIGNPLTRAAASVQAIRKFLGLLKQSFADVKRTAGNAGLFAARTRRRRGTYKKTGSVRYENRAYLWLAGYQTLGWSISQIAEAEDLERTAVGPAINRLAAELSIKLRDESLFDKQQTADLIRNKLSEVYAEISAIESFINEDPLSDSADRSYIEIIVQDAPV